MPVRDHREAFCKSAIELFVLKAFEKFWIHRSKNDIDVDTPVTALFEGLTEKFASPSSQTVSNDRGSDFSTERETNTRLARRIFKRKEGDPAAGRTLVSGRKEGNKVSSSPKDAKVLLIFHQQRSQGACDLWHDGEKELGVHL